MTPRSRVVRQTRRALENLELFGVNSLPKISKPKKEIIAAGDKQTLLEPIRQQALVCQACRLSKTRHTVVFGEGSLEAQLLFVGEGPGQEEDRQGRPFVGSAGELLNKIIQAMGMKREDVYIANVVKCRPPMNRVPEPDEVEACAGYLTAQLNIIQPKVICALGRTAATALLKTDAPLGQLRGQTFQWQGIPVVVTFHPAYLLRNPPAKSLVWQDMQRVLELLKA